MGAILPALWRPACRYTVRVARGGVLLRDAWGLPAEYVADASATVWTGCCASETCPERGEVVS